MQTAPLTAAQANRGFCLYCHVHLDCLELHCVTSIQQCWLTTRAVVTTEDIDEELVSQEPLLLVPEELSMSTNLAKQQLAPLLEAAKLPSLEVKAFTCSMVFVPHLAPIVLMPVYAHGSETFGQETLFQAVHGRNVFVKHHA